VGEAAAIHHQEAAEEPAAIRLCWATHVVTPTHHATPPVATTSQSLMRGLWAGRTSRELGYVFPGLSASWATATVIQACRGERDVRGLSEWQV